jgi:carboxyl-terminal processing protease
LDEIGEFYIEPVSTRRVAINGAAWLARLDNRLVAGDTFGGTGGTLAISYDNRPVGYLATPPENDRRAWGTFLDGVIETARQASPQIASVPRETVEQTVLDGMMAALDRFSRYATPEVARYQRASREGYGGIGIAIDGTQDIFRVTAVTPQSPADRAGIRPEDQIVAIDGVTTKGCVHRDVLDRLRGPVGSPVAVQVMAAGMSQPRDLRLQRAPVFEPTVTSSHEGGVAVLRVNSFNHNTTQRVAEALAEAQRQNGGRLAGIVLDLRSNPGGVLEQAVSLADLFLQRGTIVLVAGRHPASRQHYAASGRSIAPQTPLVVLINGGSASASEIVAAALQDAGRAVVIGSASYGKGSVQTVLRLPNNGELILTWARLGAPSGYPLQQHGVVPTICTVDLPEDASAVAAGLQRVAAGGLALRPRETLDEQAWAQLRQSCPGRRTRPAGDLALAKALFANPSYYGYALHALPGSANVAQSAALPGQR